MDKVGDKVLRTRSSGNQMVNLGLMRQRTWMHSAGALEEKALFSGDFCVA